VQPPRRDTDFGAQPELAAVGELRRGVVHHDGTVDTGQEAFGDRRVAVARELTKTFEEFRTGTLAELAQHYAQAGAPKGEVVVCVAPPGAGESTDAADVDRLLLSLAAEMGASKAAAEAARLTGGRKPDLYRRLLELKGDG